MAGVVLANHGHPVLLRSLSRGQHLGGRNGSPLRQEKGSYAQERHRASSLDKAQQSVVIGWAATPRTRTFRTQRERPCGNGRPQMAPISTYTLGSSHLHPSKSSYCRSVVS